MNRQTFYKKYDGIKNVEFINGEVVKNSPFPKMHNDVLTKLRTLVSVFVQINDLGCVGSVMITLTDNDYEPDLCYFNSEKAKHFHDNQMLFPAPDLIVEILSKGTAKNDRGIKFQDYQAHKVMEYWIIDPIKSVVEQYRLDKSGTYELILKSKEGTIESKAIKGFKIPIKAIFNEAESMPTLTELLH